MTDLVKVLLGFGLLLVAVGAILLVVGSVFGRGTWLGRLPGDIYIERGSWRFYFPLATSLLMSVVLTILLSLFSLFSRR